MSVTSTVAAGRRAAEALMTDTFTAYAPTSGTEDGLETSTWVSQGTTPGKVKGLGGLGGSDPETRVIDVGGVERLVLSGGLHIPLSAPVPEPGWEYVCTAIGPASDPALLGRRYRVVDVPVKSYATARRLDVVEV